MNKNKKMDTANFVSLPFGLCFGVVVGILTHNLALWLAIGVALGAGMSGVSTKKNHNNNKPMS